MKRVFLFLFSLISVTPLFAQSSFDEVDNFVETLKDNSHFSFELSGGYNNHPLASISFLYGIDFGQYLYSGVGISVIRARFESDNPRIESKMANGAPVFANIRLNLSKKESHGYIDYRIGYDFETVCLFNQLGGGYMFKKIPHSNIRLYTGLFWGMERECWIDPYAVLCLGLKL